MAKKTSIATLAEALGKKKGKWEKMVKSNDSIKKNTAEYKLNRINTLFDNLFELQESMKPASKQEGLPMMRRGGRIDPPYWDLNEEENYKDYKKSFNHSDKDGNNYIYNRLGELSYPGLDNVSWQFRAQNSPYKFYQTYNRDNSTKISGFENLVNKYIDSYSNESRTSTVPASILRSNTNMEKYPGYQPGTIMDNAVTIEKRPESKVYDEYKHYNTLRTEKVSPLKSINPNAPKSIPKTQLRSTQSNKFKDTSVLAGEKSPSKFGQFAKNNAGHIAQGVSILGDFFNQMHHINQMEEPTQAAFVPRVTLDKNMDTSAYRRQASEALRTGYKQTKDLPSHVSAGVRGNLLSSYLGAAGDINTQANNYRSQMMNQEAGMNMQVSAQNTQILNDLYQRQNMFRNQKAGAKSNMWGSLFGKSQMLGRDIHTENFQKNHVLPALQKGYHPDANKYVFG